MKNAKIYNLYASVFRYPDKGFTEDVTLLEKSLLYTSPAALESFLVFSSFMKDNTLFEQQELFTKTFDVQPICYLDLGYVIFGEDYKRGAFLLHMQQEQQRWNNECGTDLPDHLSNMLTLMVKMEGESISSELVHRILIPGLDKMMSEFTPARVELKVQVLKKLHKAIIQEELNNHNVYRSALESLKVFLSEEFPDKPEIEQEMKEQLERNASFFSKNSVSREVHEIINNYNIE